MLRSAVIAGSLIFLIAGAALTLAGPRAAGLYLLGVGAAVLAGTLFERWRYRPSAGPAAGPAARWQSTGERFEDPATGKTVEVLFDPATGERRYVSEESRSGGVK